MQDFDVYQALHYGAITLTVLGVLVGLFGSWITGSMMLVTALVMSLITEERRDRHFLKEIEDYANKKDQE
jgi:hypothetical protein